MDSDQPIDSAGPSEIPEYEPDPYAPDLVNPQFPPDPLVPEFPDYPLPDPYAAGEAVGTAAETDVAGTLTAVGEGIFAAEATGGAEVEAASGPVGWAVGAGAVVVAGAAIGLGYLLADDSDSDGASDASDPDAGASGSYDAGASDGDPE